MGERIRNCIPLIAAGVLFAGGCCSIAPDSGAIREGSDRGSVDAEIPVQAIAHFATALGYDLDGRPNEALDEYAQAAIEDPAYEPVVIESSRRYIRAREPEKAIPLLERSALRKEASGTIYAWLGLAYGQAGNDDKAIQANKKAIQKLPKSLAPYQNLSQIYLKKGLTNNAVAVLDQASRQPSLSADFLLDLTDLNNRFGQTRALDPETLKERVTRLLDRAAELKSESPVILQRLGDGFAGIGETDKAERAYMDLLKKFPGMPLVRGKLADLYLRSGNRDKAVEQLEELLKMNPTNAHTHAMIGMLELDGNSGTNALVHVTNAVSHLEQALALGPELENVYYDLARANLGLRKPEEALKILDRARLQFKENFISEFYTGLACASMEKYGEAVKHFLSAELLAKTQEGGPMPLNRQFYFQIGSAYERNGDIDQASQYFEKCLELSPDFAEALNYLGYMWAERGIHLDRARELIEKAVASDPENPAFLDSLAWVLFKLELPKEALPHMLKAIEKSEDVDSVLYDHLGDIHSSLGNHSSAMEAWQKSLTANDDPKVRQKLESGKGDLPQAH